MMYNVVAALLAVASAVQLATSGSLPDLKLGTTHDSSPLYPGQVAPGDQAPVRFLEVAYCARAVHRQLLSGDVERNIAGGLRIPTLSGEFVFDPDNHAAPLVIMAYDSNNAALRCVDLSSVSCPGAASSHLHEHMSMRQAKYVCHAHVKSCDPSLAPCRNMWHNNESLHDFLALATPNDTQFLFLSYVGKRAHSIPS